MLRASVALASPLRTSSTMMSAVTALRFDGAGGTDPEDASSSDGVAAKRTAASPATDDAMSSHDRSIASRVC